MRLVIGRCLLRVGLHGVEWEVFVFSGLRVGQGGMRIGMVGRRRENRGRRLGGQNRVLHALLLLLLDRSLCCYCCSDGHAVVSAVSIVLRLEDLW